MTTRAEPLKVLVVTLTLALAASLLVLVGPLTNKALSQTTPSGTLDANTLPAPDPHHYCGEWGVRGTLLGQTFTALNSGNVHSAQLFVRGFNNPPTDPWTPPRTDLSVRLTTVDASGRPDITLATTAVPGSEVGQFHSLVTANFSDPPSIEAGKQYALVLSTTESGYSWAFAEDGSCPYGSYSGGMLWVHFPADGGWLADPGNDGLTDAVFAICLNGPCPVDATPPQLNLPNSLSQTATSPDGAPVSYTATATDDVDGNNLPVDCSPASGSTFPVGTTTVNCSAEDAASNVATGSFDVSVVYDFGNGSGGGFSEPVSSSALNEVKAGAGVPVRFGLGGDFGLDIFAPGYPTSRAISCETGLPIDPIEETVAVSASGLRYDASAGQYIYNWRTDKAWSGTCRELVLKLTDGSEHTAKFIFK